MIESVPPMTPYGARYVAPEGLGPALRARARNAIRRYGMATAAARRLPDYLIIGTKRGGSTSLARWLLLHPEVRSLFPSRETRKGAYYFDVNYWRGESWYRSHFPLQLAHRLAEQRAGRRLIVGEATPYYLHHPHAAIRARRLVPDTKVIALVRNPMDRAHGHWAERTRQGVETLDFDAALDAEPERLAGEEAHMLADPSYVSFAHQHYSYVDQSRYARGLQRWMTAFPPHQVLVVRSEDMYADPAQVLDQVHDFLGLSRFTPAELNGWNRVQKSSLRPDQADRLHELLAPDIEAVEALLDRPMRWT